MINHETACHLVETAVRTIGAGPLASRELLDELPAAIYVISADGTITYFNPACVELAGREPRVGVDKWCVTWKLYTTDGEYMPHDECPMVVAVNERKLIRNLEAIAERPDGSRFRFVPYPTPVFASDGAFIGVVNLLREVADQDNRDVLTERAERCRRLAAAMQDLETAAALAAIAAGYEEQARRMTRQAREVLDSEGRRSSRRGTLQ